MDLSVSYGESLDGDKDEATKDLGRIFGMASDDSR